MKKVGFVGTGVIAAIHAEAIQAIAGTKLVAVADPAPTARQNFASRWRVDHQFETLDQMLDSQLVDTVHILTPPDSHSALVQKVLDAGLIPFVEKPVATSLSDARRTVSKATEKAIPAAVNQNAVYHPAFAQMRAHISAGKIGQLRSIQCHYEAPLRQLSAGQFSHWMFEKPGNILLEQAVHPLSQILSIANLDPTTLSVVQSPPLTIGGGQDFYDRWALSIMGDGIPAQLSFAVGSPYPLWTITAAGTDGSVSADMIRNRCVLSSQSPWLEAYDHYKDGKNNAKQIAKQSHNNFMTYALSMIGLKKRSDSFYLGMLASLTAFYESLSKSEPPLCSLEFGAKVVEICETASQSADTSHSADTNKTGPISTAQPPKTLPDADYCIIGGTGFIGRYVVQQLLAADKTLRVVARNTKGLPSYFADPRVTIVAGDARDSSLLDRAVKGASYVINLAHGGGGDSFEAVYAAMGAAAKSVAKAAAKAKVKKLVYVGSIAGLFLGNARETITEDTPPDPHAEQRADYARAKAQVDLDLKDQCAALHLPMTIIRPGLVVGAGTSPFHSGLGVFNNETHCLGWSDGNHALPFVLGADTASAIISATTSAVSDGKAYNLAGDFRPSAKDYIAALQKRTGRPLTYHGQSPAYIYLIENGKIAIKWIAGKRQGFHSLREFHSRAIFAKFDCAGAKADLNWTPEADGEKFYDAVLGNSNTSA